MRLLPARKPLTAFATLCLLAGAVLGGYAANLQVTGNFHTVIEGELYRSAQPNPAQLESYVRDHGIRTIINLRGENARAPWYEAELQTARALGVHHIDYRMSASKELSTSRADELVAIMAAAEKPILIHCQAGSDRTGLASALYSLRVAGRRESEAERQLSFYFGHVGIPHLSSAYAMDTSWETFEAYYAPEG
ncbi:protein tyrosine/serine phosphatase [Rhizobium azooxidifex]|uniref:Protein tyrosine/serine phosphatase n=1 Tax=Mycoplana azooxidifex TaxID=1636188 RepID=A0A7W6GK31_9HYPH|nr:dual specificity protein phosphatase family protein [Mycoplana azooxidifex]MBB3976504.1 protein tyrosine/serine phosphatase [Mycoplana azooxidifex]